MLPAFISLHAVHRGTHTMARTLVIILDSRTTRKQTRGEGHFHTYRGIDRGGLFIATRGNTRNILHGRIGVSTFSDNHVNRTSRGILRVGISSTSCVEVPVSRCTESFSSSIGIIEVIDDNGRTGDRRRGIRGTGVVTDTVHIINIKVVGIARDFPLDSVDVGHDQIRLTFATPVFLHKLAELNGNRSPFRGSIDCSHVLVPLCQRTFFIALHGGLQVVGSSLVLVRNGGATGQASGNVHAQGGRTLCANYGIRDTGATARRTASARIEVHHLTTITVSSIANGGTGTGGIGIPVVAGTRLGGLAGTFFEVIDVHACCRGSGRGFRRRGAFSSCGRTGRHANTSRFLPLVAAGINIYR